MITLIYGGSGSGKSEYAEDIVRAANYKNSFYLATMSSGDEESKKRIKRHREQRAGKGFITLEHSVDIQNSILEIQSISSGDFETDLPADRETIVLLECMSNLVANEMFRDGVINSKEHCVNKIMSDVLELNSQVSRLVIVSNNIYEDGVSYEKETTDYLSALAEINCRLANMAESVTEVVVGIPVSIK